MATITGPKVSMPSAKSQIASIIDNKTLALNTEWGTLFAALVQIAFNGTRSGPTASRPTEAVPGRWIGMPFYDTTLGEPVFLDSVNPDVWHNGAGAVV